ncbi:MAG: penicillin-binding transpeptidase domain-containing protein, partial [Aeromonas veronii]
LGKMVSGKLPVSTQTLQYTANILKVSEIDGWQIHGKTGMGYPKKLDGSLNRDQQIGWFVGWASKPGKQLIFVHTVVQKPGKQFASLKAKEEVLAALPAQLKKQ